MENIYSGVNFNNLRKSIYLILFGVNNGECNNFNTEKYKYILPMQNQFDNPLGDYSKDTYCLYWIEDDESLTQDDYEEDIEEGWVNSNKCVASVFLRFIGVCAEDWAKQFRHLTKRTSVAKIFAGVCNAERLEAVSPIRPYRVNFSGDNNQIAFDLRIKLYYKENIKLNWSQLEGLDFKTLGTIKKESEE